MPSLVAVLFRGPTLRVQLQVLDHLRCKSSVSRYPVARTALEIAGAGAWPDEGIGAQIALDVGRDDFTGDALTGHEPLVTPRHGE